jgi:hypothetical protein
MAGVGADSLCPAFRVVGVVVDFGAIRSSQNVEDTSLKSLFGMQLCNFFCI